jgi:hypothetical protein
VWYAELFAPALDKAGEEHFGEALWKMELAHVRARYLIEVPERDLDDGPVEVTE